MIVKLHHQLVGNVDVLHVGVGVVHPHAVVDAGIIPLVKMIDVIVIMTVVTAVIVLVVQMIG